MPSLLLPSGKAAHKTAATYIPHIHCKQCFTNTGALNHLQATDDSLVACHTCGFVDERSTWAHSAVSVPDTLHNKAVLPSDTGIYTGLRGDTRVSFAEMWGTFDTNLERRFKDEVDALFRMYLQDPQTCLFDSPAPSLVQPAKIWFLRIRQREKETRSRRFQSNPGGRQSSATLAAYPGSRRTKYQVVVAIRFAAQDANLVHANARLDRDDKDSVHDLIGRADERPFAFPLDQLWRRTHRPSSLGQGGALDSLHYLYTINKKCCALVGRSLSPVDGFLCFLLQTVRHLQTLYEYILAGQYDKFITRPTSGGASGSTCRPWDKSDFSWFREHNFDWQHVLQASYDLYRAQQCVLLWGKRPSIQAAACLALYGCIAIAGQVMPQSTLILTEMCAFFKVDPHVAFNRMGELRKMLCAWLTSFEHAGVARPQLLCPVQGGIGNGLSGWHSDKRRAIPELEIAALSAQVVHKHWRAIARARSRTPPMHSYSVELDKARVLVARAGPRYRPGTEPRAATRKKVFGADYSQYLLDTSSSATTPSRVAAPLSVQSGPTRTRASSPTPVPVVVPVTRTNNSSSRPKSEGQIPMTPSQSLPEHYLDDIQDPSLDSQDAPHIGILVRERQHYVAYDHVLERRRGNLVPEDVERAMHKWLVAQQKAGSIPLWKDIDKEYLVRLGIRDDERELRRPGGVDLGPWIQRVKDDMSPTEALLRAGVRPLEFPLHYIVRSLDELHSQLDLVGIQGILPRTTPRAAVVDNANLAPIGTAIDEAQLDAELALLFSDEMTTERISQVFCSKEEVARRRVVYDALDAEEALNRGGSSEDRRGPVGLVDDAEEERLSILLAALLDSDNDRHASKEPVVGNRGLDIATGRRDDEQVCLAVVNAGLGLDLGPSDGGAHARVPLSHLGLDQEDGGEEESVDDDDEYLEGGIVVPTDETEVAVADGVVAMGQNNQKKRGSAGDGQQPRKRGRLLKVGNGHVQSSHTL